MNKKKKTRKEKVRSLSDANWKKHRSLSMQLADSTFVVLCV